VSQVEARIQEFQAKLNPMSTSFIYGSQGSNSANEEAQVRAALTRAEAELAEARRALAAANESLEGARQGRPPAASTPAPH
jgi:cob(I)alamin adenosyltransferase